MKYIQVIVGEASCRSWGKWSVLFQGSCYFRCGGNTELFRLCLAIFSYFVVVEAARISERQKGLSPEYHISNYQDM